MSKMFSSNPFLKLFVTLFLVTSASSCALAADAKKLYWPGPITPAHGAAPTVGTNQMKLVDVHGPVSVKTADGNTIPGTNGLIIPSGATIFTAANASAAVFMGGVNSARFLPNTQATVDQSLAGSVRKTDVNLRKGTVFCRVGRRTGESQDYKVHTPQGVAAARGTKFGVSCVDFNGKSYTIDYTDEGATTLTITDGSGNVITVTPNGPNGQVSVGTVPADLSLATTQSILLNLLNVFAPFNTTGSEPVTSLEDVATSLTTSIGTAGATKTTVDNGDGTTTTKTTATLGNGTVVETDVTTDATGAVTTTTSSVTTTDPTTGQTTTTTTTTDSGGTSTTNGTGTSGTGENGGLPLPLSPNGPTGGPGQDKSPDTVTDRNLNGNLNGAKDNTGNTTPF